MGYHVDEATNPDDALEIWELNNSKFDLLISDMVMPGEINGLELAIKLKAEKPALKVLITGGYSMDLQSSDTLAQQRFHFLPKPFEMATLALTIKKCLSGSASNPPQLRPGHQRQN